MLRVVLGQSTELLRLDPAHAVDLLRCCAIPGADGWQISDISVNKVDLRRFLALVLGRGAEQVEGTGSVVPPGWREGVAADLRRPSPISVPAGAGSF